MADAELRAAFAALMVESRHADVLASAPPGMPPERGNARSRDGRHAEATVAADELLMKQRRLSEGSG
jgi:hypothetical protein